MLFKYCLFRVKCRLCIARDIVFSSRSRRVAEIPFDREAKITDDSLDRKLFLALHDKHSICYLSVA